MVTRLDALQAVPPMESIAWFANANTILEDQIVMSVSHFTMTNHGEERLTKTRMNAEVRKSATRQIKYVLISNFNLI